MVYHMQINKCNTAHKQNQGQNPHNLNIWKKKKKKEKAFNRIQHFFIVKPLEKLGIERTHLNIIKATSDKPIANIILNGEKLKLFPQKSGKKSLSLLFFKIVLEFLVRAIRQEKGIERM
jgi:hypothetical protein